jgi:serine phosphatase RsbU (regulator of sigma subunit)/anti-sigma regulatory factor (Ser/Thr protein kinase)
VSSARDRALAELQRITESPRSHPTPDDILAQLLELITEILESDTAAFLMLDEDRDVLVARAAKGIEEGVRRGVRIPVGGGFAGRIAAERRPIAIDDVDHADILNPLLRDRGIKSLLGVPLELDGRMIGVLHVGTVTRREFTDADAELLTKAAERAARAVDQAQAYEERLLAQVLQRQLLRSRLLDIPGVEISGRYLPAAKAGRLGGDWYDKFTLADGRLALVIGDAVGRGIAAASLMAQVRTAVRAYALEGHQPAAVAERLNDLLLRTERSHTATLAFLAFDYEAGTVDGVSAGHLPPILMCPGEAPKLIDLGTAPPLGASRLARFTSRTFEMPVDSVLVLYTDGLVERREESIEAGLDRILEVAARASRKPLELCDDLIDELVGPDNDDDVAVTAIRVLPVPARLHLRLAAEPDELAMLRRQLGRWLTQVGAARDEAYDLTLATSEAAANALEHAYGPGSATFEVDAEEDGGDIRITVRDRGSWRPPKESDRGRGLMLMHALVETVDVETSERGTEVVLRRKLKTMAA